MGRDAYAHMMEGNPNPEDKELLIIPGAVHTDLYDNLAVIPFDKIQNFFQTYLKRTHKKQTDKETETP